MSKGKRLSILTEAEITELYSPPVFSEADERFFFARKDRLEVINRVRDHKQRAVAIVLLGYFKSKPILLNPSFKLMQAGLSFVSELFFKDQKFRQFSLKSDQKSRLTSVYCCYLAFLIGMTLNTRLGLLTISLKRPIDGWHHELYLTQR